MYTLVLLALLLIGDPAPASLNLDASSLADGPYSEMSMVYQKGILFISVDVLDLEIRFGPDATRQFQSVLEGRDEVSSKLEQKIVSAAFSADNVLVEIQFLRDIDLQRFIQEARRNTKRAYDAGMIDESELKRVDQNLPEWYASLRGRNIRENDRMFYRIQHQSMRTVFLGVDGKVYVDQVDQGESAGRTMLAGYLAPGSGFRSELIESLARRSP